MVQNKIGWGDCSLFAQSLFQLKSTVRCLCVVELHVALNYVKNWVFHNNALRRIYVPGNNKTAITTPPFRIHNDTSHWDKFLLDRTGWIDVCTHGLRITTIDIGLRPATCQNYSYNKIQQYVDCLLADSQHN